jgi:hypothetical protein
MAERIMISDDDLILYYYRDGLPADERARINAALAEDPELSKRYHNLTRRLDAAAAAPAHEVPVPMKYQRRWAAALEEKVTETPAERLANRRGLFAKYSLAYGMAASAFVAIFSLWFVVYRVSAPKPPVPVTSNVSAYERGLKSHLANTEQQLASLESATPEEREHLVETIIEQNRIYALAAERAGEPQLARVLRAFSPVLESVAKGDQNTAANVAQLAFELRVMQDRLATGKASHSQSTAL